MYKNNIKEAMTLLSKNPSTIFVGYGLGEGTSKGGGMLSDVPSGSIIETPVAENLMASMAIGLSLQGYTPIVIIERMDFIMNCMDAIVNHLDKTELISKGEFNPKVIFRCIVGGKTKPFFTGKTHTSDYSYGIGSMVSFPVIRLQSPSHIIPVYQQAMASTKSSIIVEYKDLYDCY